MSSPLDRDLGPDEPSPFAPKRSRDATLGQGQEETSEFQEHIEDPASSNLSAAEQSNAAEGFAIEGCHVPPSLDPTRIPDSWGPSRRRSGLGVLVLWVLGIGVAVIATWFVVGKLPGPGSLVRLDDSERPSFGSRFWGQVQQVAERPQPPLPQLSAYPAAAHNQGEAFPLALAITGPAAGASVVLDGLAPGSTLNVGSPLGINGWRLAPIDLRSAVVRPPKDFVGPMDVVLELRLADALVERKSLHLEWSGAPSKQSTSQPLRQIDRMEIADLIKRGEVFIATGDLASARLLLQRAAEAGDQNAALMLGKTYDPIVLEQRGIQGFASDIGKARSWYEWAKEFGSAEAPRRLEMLVTRDH